MGRPQPCVLFAQSFLHPTLSEYVDEVRFTEPVVICACEFLELHTSSLCPTLSLSGVSSPQSFALEIFIRNGGEARFKRLCPAFLYSPSTSSLLDVQAAVTDHLVIRGSYRALTLVVYGNPAKDLGQFNADYDIDNTLSDLILPSEAVYDADDLPEALQIEREKPQKVTPLRHLQLVYSDPKQVSLVRQVLNSAVGVVKSFSDHDTATKVFNILLSVASTLRHEHSGENGSPQFPVPLTAHMQHRRRIMISLREARIQIQEVLNQLRKNMDGCIEQSLIQENELLVMEMIWTWLQMRLQSLPRMMDYMSREESLMGGLAAVQLLCTDTNWCFRFVVAGGMGLLVDVLHYASIESSAIALLALGTIKCACGHAFACEAFLGWWTSTSLTAETKNGFSPGYSVILRLLLQTKRFHVAHLATQILHHLRAYELASTIQSLVETFLEGSSSVMKEQKTELGLSHTIGEANAILKQFVRSLTAKDSPQDWSPAQLAQWLILDCDDSAPALQPNATYSLIASSKYSFKLQDFNAHTLAVLQERRLIASLAAFLSSPLMRSATGHIKDLFLEFLGIVQTFLLSLINSRSGLLFLATDMEAAGAIVSALEGIHEVPEYDYSNLRHASSLTSAGFLCLPQDVAGILRTSLLVMSGIDRLLGATQWSEDWLWALWDLGVFSRSEIGRHALSALSHFPEGFAAIMKALQPGSQILSAEVTEGRALKRAILHSAAEIMQAILMDPAACILAAWIPHALSLQKALLSCSPTNIDIAVGSHAVALGSKDALCARLLEWVDAAVVYQRKGAVGLLRYAAALVAGSVNQMAVVGMQASDPIEPDGCMGEVAGNTELPTVETVLGRSVTLGVSGTILSDTAVVQLTVSLRILSSISCHSGVAAVLYGEGAMAILYILLEYGASFLQTSTSDYDCLVEEEGEGDGTTELLMEQGRERLLMNLLLPTLLLLLNLLRRLQVTGEEYRNTRLVETLLQLHRGVSARLTSRATVSAEAGGMLVLSAVARVLISVLALWPVFGWTPSLFSKLLGAGASPSLPNSNPLPSEPLEPREASSVLRILAEMLPEESPQLCTNTGGAMSIFRSLSVQTVLGVKSMTLVGWHCQPPDSQKLMQTLSPHLDQIAFIFFHLACTTCIVLQELLKMLLVRMACQNKDYGAALIRPVLNYVRENSLAGVSASDVDAFRVERFLEFLSQLLGHPIMKRLLLQEGLVEVLLQAVVAKKSATKGDNNLLAADEFTGYLSWCPYIFDSFSSLCDPDVSSFFLAPLDRRLVEDCPTFGDYCNILASLLNFCLIAPLGKEVEIAAEAMGNLASHRLGRAAFASVALSMCSSSTQSDTGQKNPLEFPTVNNAGESQDARPENAGEILSPSFVRIWERLATTLEADKDSLTVIVGIIEQFSLTAIKLSASGRSACGVGALQVLFESNIDLHTKDIGSREGMEPLVFIIRLLQEKVEEFQEDKDGSASRVLQKISLEKAHKAIKVLSRLLERPIAFTDLDKKVKAVVDSLPSPQSQSLQETEANITKMPPRWSMLPALFSKIKEDANMKLNVGSPEEDTDIDLKEKFTWECTAALPDKPSMMSAASKRKASATADGGSKRHRTDGGSIGAAIEVGTSVGGSQTARPGTGSISSVSGSNRRDTFRQRKPNTSRPPSMHVDDYVARERGSEALSVANGGLSQRSGSSGGRPPSIHVDEFMARQRERQQVVGAPIIPDFQPPSVPPPQSHSPPPKAESVSNKFHNRVRSILTEDEELADVDIEIDGVLDADNFLSLPVVEDLVVMGKEASSGLPPVSNDAETSGILLSSRSRPMEINTMEVLRTGSSLQDVLSTDKTEDLTKQTEANSADLQSQVMAIGQQIQLQNDEKGEVSFVRSKGPQSIVTSFQSSEVPAPLVMDMVAPLGVSLQSLESSGTSMATSVPLNVGEQRPAMPQNASPFPSRGQVQFPVAPPLPPPLPPPPPIPAGVVPQKFDSFISPGMEQRPRLSASLPPPSFEPPVNSGMGVEAAREKRPPLPSDFNRGIAESSSSTPPPLPVGPWPPLESAGRRIDSAHRPPVTPFSYSSVTSSQPLRPVVDAALGASVMHTPVSPWTGIPRITEEGSSSGTGRPHPPPLPPTPPPFPGSQASFIQVSPLIPSSIPPPSLYSHTIGGLSTEHRPPYNLSSMVDSSSIDQRFSPFSTSILGQSVLPLSIPSSVSFLPPLPPGRPNTSQSFLVSGVPLQQQKQPLHHPQALPPPPPPQQSEQIMPLPQQQQPQFQQQAHQPVKQQSPQQQLQQSQQAQQQESGKLLQQILASPDAIQDLLKDQNKLQQLLEQHPKLISLLQEKMGQG